MATLANLENLKLELMRVDDKSNPHVWADEDGSLRIGTFPTAVFSFCFATEKILSLEVPQSSNVKFDPQSATITKGIRDVSSKAARKTERICLSFEDLDVICGSAKQALLEGLSEIERRVPGTLDKLSLLKGRSKRPVHRERKMLYDLPSQARYAEQVESGHWIATNNKRREALEVLEVAADVANLQFKLC